jgi:hypothetical protein
VCTDDGAGRTTAHGGAARGGVIREANALLIFSTGVRDVVQMAEAGRERVRKSFNVVL